MKKILSFLCVSSIFASNLFVAYAKPVVPSQYYKDLNDSHSFFKAIEFISGKKIVKGYDDGTYKPEKTLNRAELLKILVAAKYEEKDYNSYDAANCFTDVPTNEWYTKYVCFGKKIGIVEGYKDGSFKPENSVNLVEGLKMALTTFQYHYKDSDPWYKGVIDSASEYNLIPLNFKHFDDKVNRGQMADLIARILKLEDSSLVEYLGTDINFTVNYDSLLKGHDVKKTGGEKGELISKVCGDVNENGTFTCTEAKKKIYKCLSVTAETYGTHKFLSCFMTQIGNAKVLRSSGGLLDGGYNFISEKDGKIIIINSVIKLLEDWGEIDSEDSAKFFAMAASGNSAMEPGTHFIDAFGPDFELSVPDADVKFTVVKKTGNQYEVPLYARTIFGCSNFPVYQNIYTVSNTGITVKETKQIGVVKNEGLCAD